MSLYKDIYHKDYVKDSSIQETADTSGPAVAKKTKGADESSSVLSRPVPIDNKQLSLAPAIEPGTTITVEDPMIQGAAEVISASHEIG